MITRYVTKQHLLTKNGGLLRASLFCELCALPSSFSMAAVTDEPRRETAACGRGRTAALW